MPHPAQSCRFARHAPAGQSIDWSVAIGRAQVPARFPWAGLRTRYFTSGSAALVMAIREALDQLSARPPSRRVVLPAYGCPNLLAAVLKAGAEPEFVDLAAGSLVPDPQLLLHRLAAGDRVVLSVDPFGSSSFHPDFLAVLDDQMRRRLVHDLAQSFGPFDPRWRPEAQATVISFGRAKPVSLTAFGALLSRPGDTEADSRISSCRAVGADDSAALRLKVILRSIAYNFSLQPAAFGTLSRLQFLGIGATKFVPLDDVTELAPSIGSYVAAAMAQFERRRQYLVSATQRMLQIALDAGAEVPAAVQSLAGEGYPLWRVPVVHGCEAGAERFMRWASSLGVSRLYGRTLGEFAGVNSAEARRRWPVAWQLSRTLTTLPAHGRLGEHEQQDLRHWLKVSRRNV